MENVAETIDVARQVMLILGAEPMTVKSWGFNTPKDIPDGIEFGVKGLKFRGKVRVLYDYTNDSFNVSLISKNEVVKTIQNVLFDNVSKKNGIRFSRENISSLSIKELEALITPETKAIYIETPTNPMMNITNIEQTAKIAHAHNALMIVDNTFMSPYFQNPLSLGADIVLHSGTKYLSGHNDTLSGFIVTNRSDIVEKLRFLIKTTGAGLSPFDSWLTLRGIKTLSVRMEKAQENALKIARWLKNQKEVTKVLYPGFENHPGYEIQKKQARGFGAMLTFNVISEEKAKSILNKVRLIQFAESLGGVETLITYPVTQTHADVPEEIRLKNGITPSTLRLSVGIENVDDLIEDLSQAF